MLAGVRSKRLSLILIPGQLAFTVVCGPWSRSVAGLEPTADYLMRAPIVASEIHNRDEACVRPAIVRQVSEKHRLAVISTILRCMRGNRVSSGRKFLNGICLDT
ncbi:hypothetical protein DPEC_G00098070 [Dallia pectoralis]|uniref:Uncharacterized protein n=1 Tax=Dallia pectoralis TaxID=75939 RepID=A0ACC2GWE0_DALPE|nr:hypothetical protein DPEC_G00098070 [Dallia pectoralis]